MDLGFKNVLEILFHGRTLERKETMGKIKFSECVTSNEEFNDHEKYRAIKFRE